MKQDISKNITEKIQKEHISPTPKWIFIVKNITFWVFGGVSLVLGAIGFAVILFFFENTSWVLEKRILANIGHLPFFWIISFLVFLFVADSLIRQTKRGYTKSFLVIIGISLGTSMLLGAVLFYGGVGKYTDEALGKHMHPYHSLNEKREQRWNHPEEGRLFGKVIAFSLKENTLIIQDAHHKQWHISKEHILPEEKNFIEKQVKVRIIGEKQGKEQFFACAILRGDMHEKPKKESQDKYAKETHENKKAYKNERKLEEQRIKKCLGK